jgi:hypothetical protein
VLGSEDNHRLLGLPDMSVRVTYPRCVRHWPGSSAKSWANIPAGDHVLVLGKVINVASCWISKPSRCPIAKPAQWTAPLSYFPKLSVIHGAALREDITIDQPHGCSWVHQSIGRTRACELDPLQAPSGEAELW